MILIYVINPKVLDQVVVPKSDIWCEKIFFSKEKKGTVNELGEFREQTAEYQMIEKSMNWKEKKNPQSASWEPKNK